MLGANFPLVPVLATRKRDALSCFPRHFYPHVVGPWCYDSNVEHEGRDGALSRWVPRH